MEILIGVIVILVIAVVVLSKKRTPHASSGGSRSSSGASQSKQDRVLAENLGWLEERWDLVRDEQDRGELKTVPPWFFDDVTERQLNRIDQIGLEIAKGQPTKGEASDIIGLFEPAEEEDVEVLRFFKVPSRGMNQSKARHLVTNLFQDPKNVNAWEARPASAMQKEFYKYFDLNIPKGLTHEEASRFISEYGNQLMEEDEKALDDWDAYESIYEEINDPDYREDYGVKKISLSTYRDVMHELRNEGKTPSDLEDDPDVVVDKIILKKPDIQRA